MELHQEWDSRVQICQIKHVGLPAGVMTIEEASTILSARRGKNNQSHFIYKNYGDERENSSGKHIS